MERRNSASFFNKLRLTEIVRQIHSCSSALSATLKHALSVAGMKRGGVGCGDKPSLFQPCIKLKCSCIYNTKHNRGCTGQLPNIIYVNNQCHVIRMGIKKELNLLLVTMVPTGILEDTLTVTHYRKYRIGKDNFMKI